MPAKICKNTHQHHRRKQVFNAMTGDQGHHDNGERAGCPRNHPSATANDCSNQANDKGRI